MVFAIGLAISLVCFGLFFEFSSCLLSVVLIIFLFKRQELKITQTFLIVSVIALSYLTSILFAVDKPLAFIGFIKFLPIALFALLISQLKLSEREKMVDIIPYFSLSLLAVSAFLSLFDNTLADFFTVNGELSGFFQYPNTFALFLTMSLLIIIKNFWDRKIIISSLFAQILLLGIVLSKSRTGLILAVLFLVFCLFIKEYRKASLTILLTSVAISLFVLAIVLIWGQSQYLATLFTKSMNLSTIYGRIIYALDALPQILTHPLGLGYYGYYFAQASFQSAVYEVVYVHNDFLQLFLDAGWLAGVALIVLVFRSLFSKKISKLFKLIIACISVFSLLDFHLQYILIFILLVLVLDFDKTVGKAKVKQGLIMKISLVVLACLNVYFGIALSAEYFGNNDLSLMLYPNTRIKLEQLVECEDISTANILADEIINQNEYVAYAYAVKSIYYYSIGDFQNLIGYKLKELSLSKYSIEAYTEFFYMLEVGVELYEEEGYIESAEYCEFYIRQISEMLVEVESNTSGLAYKINDIPKFDLPDEYIEYIN